MSKWTQVGGGGGSFVKWETEGQTLEGHWQGAYDGKFGPCGSLKKADGVLVRFPLHTALLDRMKRVKDGAEVLIEYTGKQESKQGRIFKGFTVSVANPEDILSDGDEEAPF